MRHFEANRRLFLQHSTFLTASTLITGPLLAEQLLETPRMTEGPFYPDRLPLDTDNDLLIINQSITPAVGEILHLTGRVLSAAGGPLRNAFVEIWQVDHHGAYIHSQSGNAAQRDGNFQGYGRFLTDSTGAYYFRTVKPVPYPGRTPHIHVAVSRNGQRLLTSQLLLKGHPQNERDGVFRAVTEPKLRELVLLDLQPLPDSTIGELHARADLIVGITPAEDEQGVLRGGIAPPQAGGRRPSGPEGGAPGSDRPRRPSR